MKGSRAFTYAEPKVQLSSSLRQKGLDRSEIWKAMQCTDGASNRNDVPPGILLHTPDQQPHVHGILAYHAKLSGDFETGYGNRSSPHPQAPGQERCGRIRAFCGDMDHCGAAKPEVLLHL